MCSYKQGQNEDAFKFYEKINKQLNLSIAYVQVRPELDQVQVTPFIKKLGLRCLLKGLNEPLGSLMRTKNPTNMGAAASILINDFQFIPSFRNTSNKPQNNNLQNHRKYPEQTAQSSDKFKKPVYYSQQNPKQNEKTFQKKPLIQPSSFNPNKPRISSQTYNKPQQTYHKQQFAPPRSDPMSARTTRTTYPMNVMESNNPSAGDPDSQEIQYYEPDESTQNIDESGDLEEIFLDEESEFSTSQ
ncbi:hypothetical protein GE061_003537 [Apolygus lucorum]|uniref:Uncharacterized protein n=1 Tax=Apolygus lucorum TaxID=248454 RepID=A0A8S9X2B6_APOLU|nr:hypothetical protein GE061_003537 [Apolygus lucorum]